MQLNFSQQMKMSQQMKLAPRMIQSMEILQLPIMALKERIEEELRENEMLVDQLADLDAPEIQAQIDRAHEEASEKPIESRELVCDGKDSEADFERLLEMSEDWPNDDYISQRKSSNRMDDEGDQYSDMMSNMVTRPESLQDHLLEQFRFAESCPDVKAFGEYLIQNLDANGRLPTSLQEMVQVYGERISLDDAQVALSLIQKLEPLGVGARDLKECLLLQITDNTPYREILITLISSHLEDLAQNRLPLIERKTGYDIEDIKDAYEVLRGLDPTPGRGFEQISAPNVVPDLYVEPNEKGEWTVRLEDEYTPRLHISKQYREMLQKGGADPKTREYIKRKIESAKWLMESIEQRYSTLRRVAQAIVDKQTEFLENGPEYIQPLKMQQIAEVVGVHVTTVSRAVDDKWIQTPRGIYPLKRFFGGGTKTDDGEDVAWDIIRIKLKKIVEEEDKDEPLSDDALVEKLAAEGYTLARRTVTKYRKALNIPSSRQRRQY
ncbi:MAG: polymerase sigma-54 factor, RpoN [Planctomycetaceae bacterium]|nr:polymerase sigma-54 factor, RpoN [Planctomycetaceae bacterium]